MNERQSLGYFETLIVNYDAKGKGYDKVDKELWMSYEFFKDVIKENAQLKQQLKDKDEKISKIYEIKKDILTRYKLQDGNDKSREFYYMQCIDLILNILESNKED